MAADRSFRRDDTASIAVEFAVLMPLLAVLLFGSVTASRLARASMKLWTAAQSLSDLVAQQTSVSSSDVSDFCTGAGLTLAPVKGTLTATVASVTQSSTGTTAVDWQDTTCGNGATLPNAASLGSSYVPNPKDSVIVVQATYVYVFPPSYILPSSITLTRTTYSRPRDGTQVTHG